MLYLKPAHLHCSDAQVLPCRFSGKQKTAQEATARIYGAGLSGSQANTLPAQHAVQRYDMRNAALLSLLLALAVLGHSPALADERTDSLSPPAHNVMPEMMPDPALDPALDPAHEQPHEIDAPPPEKGGPPPAHAPQDESSAETGRPETGAGAESLPVELRQLPPLEEMVTSPFGPRRMPTWLSRRGMVVRQHGGVDLRARLGWPVVAYKGGEVIRSGADGASGIVVDILQEDGMTARYAHLEKTLARKGQKVEKGEKIGLVGCTGRTTGAHLHFGLRDATGKLVDPLPFLSRAEDVLRPDPEAIPEELTPQACGPVMRGRQGRPVRPGRSLQELENYTPPPIPRWGEKSPR